jgi:hypothetical protein
VQTFDAAARGGPAGPSPALAQFLAGVLIGAGAATDRAGTPILCADHAVSRNPQTYFADIQAHRAEGPLFEPLARNISPCAFWPVRPVEPVTTIHNSAPVLITARRLPPRRLLRRGERLHRLGRDGLPARRSPPGKGPDV